MKILLFLLLLMSVKLTGQETSYICEGNSVTLRINAVTGNPPYTYQWTNPVMGVTTSQTVSGSMPGVYVWELTDAYGCDLTGTHTVILEEDPLSGMTINATNKCINTGQTISASGVPPGYTYSWSFGSGSSPSTSTGALTSVLYTTTGTKTITLTITKTLTSSTNGCDASCSWVKTTTILIGELTGGSSCE